MKIDFKKTLDSYRAKHGEFRIVEVPPLQYVMLDGHGDPNASTEFGTALDTLYPLAYAVKFASRNDLGRDYVVPPLEGLWWAESERAFTSERDKSAWSWTLMILAPDWITPEMFASAQAAVAAKNEQARVGAARLAPLVEGTCVQTLHLGAFDDEWQTLEKLHLDFVPSHGLELTGLHHEIYFSDFRRVEPAKFRTILRQPVRGVPSGAGTSHGPRPSEPLTP